MKRLHTSLVSLLLAAPAAAQSAPPDANVPPSRIDSVFARFAGPATPGCAVGVSRDGREVLSRAYGMAELEHDRPNTPGTIFEAGSVSKQATAAAVLLLAQDGKLSLDDDVRRYLPEVPDYGTPITVRHLLNHTSGLRDWGVVVAIAGWPRGTRTYSHAHVLDVVKRQKALNHRPGEYFSYTNTGYNLLTILVERVSGTPFPEFTRTRLFEPLGMRDTGWRDDFTRVVKGRAVAYRPAQGGEFRMEMPFENVFGNGGLLTTVSDLLRWTENLRTGEVGGPAFVREMHRRGRLTGGREIEYAAGVMVTRHRDLPEVSHSGATAGYRAFLARYPEQGLGVAVLCNAAHANAPALARQVADFYLPEAAERGAGEAPVELAPGALAARAGTYRDTRTAQALRLVASEGRLRIENGPPLTPVSATRYRAGSSVWFLFDDAPGTGFRLVAPDGDTVRYERTAAFTPTAWQLADYAGTYHSDEAEAAFTFTVEGDRLLLRSAGGNPLPLTPAYPDAFTAGAGLFRFARDRAGRVVRVDAVSDRVWAMPFERRR